MKKTMGHRLTRKSRTAVVAGIAAGVLSLGAAGTALAVGGHESGAAAGTAATATTSAHTDDVENTVVKNVSGFYQDYISAKGEGNDTQAAKLRSSHIDQGYSGELAAWEKKNDADGVLRSQHVPVRADVSYDGSGMGHSWTVVKLTWDSGKTTTLHVQSGIQSQKISGIQADGS